MPENPSFTVEAVAEGEATRFAVTPAGGETRHYFVEGGEQHHYSAFHEELGHDYGMRIPHQWEGPPPSDGPEPDWRPLLTSNLSPRILAGYGDPAVLKTDDGWYLVAKGLVVGYL